METVKKPQLLPPPLSSLLFPPTTGFPSCSRMLHRGMPELVVSREVAIDVATKQKSKDFMRSPRLGDAAVVYDFMATLLRDLSIALLSVFFLSSFFFLPLTYWSLSFTTTFLELAYRKVLLLMYDGSLEVDLGLSTRRNCKERQDLWQSRSS